MTVRYMRRRKNMKNTSRILEKRKSKQLTNVFHFILGTPVDAPTTADSPLSDTREKLLTNGSNTANETS